MRTLDRQPTIEDRPTQLNRCAIILAPKAPYVAWANGVDTEGPRYEETLDDEGEPVFLGPDVDTVEDARAFVMKNFDYFFEYYLEQWYLDETKWPKPRTRKMFLEWFDISISSMVEDVVDAPLELE